MQFLCSQMDVECDIKPTVNETTVRVPRGSEEGYDDVNYNYGYEEDYGYHEEDSEDEGHHRKKWKHKHKGKHKHKHKKRKYSKFRIVLVSIRSKPCAIFGPTSSLILLFI